MWGTSDQKTHGPTVSVSFASAKEMPKPTKGAIWIALEAKGAVTFLVRKKGEENGEFFGES